ncbi:E3 ubiquitin-protein ligase PDZRN3-B, partial [Dissostichus eleginoides]
MCADCPTARAEKEPTCQVLNRGLMESQTELQAGRGVCQRGCGLRLSGEDMSSGQHCCVEALRTVTEALEERSATLEHETRMQRLRWNRREQSLLAQVTALQTEAQLSALQHQRRLHQYMLHIHSLAEQLTGYCQRDVRTTADIQNKISDKEGESQEQFKAPE